MAGTVWFLKQSRLFQQLTTDEVSTLEGRARVREFASKQIIYTPSDLAESVLLVIKGRVRIISLTPEGKEAVLALIEPGELFGELALVSSGTREEYAETAAPSTIAVLPREALEQAMSANTQVSLGIWKFIGWRRQRIERRLRGLMFRSTRERLVFLLLDLLEHYGFPVPQGIELRIKLSHQELANLIAATRESVTVALGELQLEGLLQTGRQKIVITSAERLAAVVGSSVPPAGENDRTSRKLPSSGKLFS